MEKSKMFNLNTLQALTVKRSKQWSTLFEKIAERADTAEISIEEIDKYYEDEPESSNDGSENMESEEEENTEELEVLQDFSNSIVNCKNKDETVQEFLSRTMQSKTQSQTIQELLSVLDSTLPVIEAHRLSLEKPTIKQVLNSFNAQEIERKADTLLHQSHANNNLPSLFKNISPISKSQELESSSDESLHSDETARYIRSSRKQRSHASSMIIKTYRQVKSKRDALREKYAVSRLDTDDSDYDRYLRHQRLQKQRYASSLNGVHGCKSKYESERKKKLRRIHSLPRSYSSSSDLSSDESPVCPRQRGSSTTKKMKYRSVSPISCFKRARRTSRSPSFDRYAGPCGCCRSKVRKYKRENECSCFRDDALCENYIHVANTSNEDWIVANCTPKKRTIKKRRAYSEEVPRRSKAFLQKLPKLAPSRGLSFDISGISPFSSTVLSLQNSNKNYAQKAALSKIEEEGMSEPNSKKESCNENCDESTKNKVTKQNPIEDQPINVEKIERKVTKRTTKSVANAETEQKTTKQCQTKEKEKQTKKPVKTKKSVTNSTKKTTNSKIVEQNTSSGSEELAKAIEESKKSYAAEQKLTRKSNIEVEMENKNEAETIEENVQKNENSNGNNKSLLNKSSSKISAMNESNSSKKILVYKPGVTTDVELKNGRVQFSCEYLAKKIGEERARLFYKFYAGKKDFNAKLHVYFCPPTSDHDSNNDSESEDELFCFGKYGYLTEEK